VAWRPVKSKEINALLYKQTNKKGPDSEVSTFN
jgi:hypothetical protein